MKRGMGGSEPVAARVDDAKPVRPQGVGMAGKQFVSRTEDDALRSQRWINLVADDVAIHGSQPTGEPP